MPFFFSSNDAVCYRRGCNKTVQNVTRFSDLNSQSVDRLLVFKPELFSNSARVRRRGQSCRRLLPVRLMNRTIETGGGSNGIGTSAAAKLQRQRNMLQRAETDISSMVDNFINMIPATKASHTCLPHSVLCSCAYMS